MYYSLSLDLSFAFESVVLGFERISGMDLAFLGFSRTPFTNTPLILIPVFG
jgi:hypothetical protein